MAISAVTPTSRSRLPPNLRSRIPFYLLIVPHVLALTLLVALADLSLLVALLIKPFSEDKAWEWACWTAGWFWGYMQHHWEVELNAEEAIRVTGDKIPKGESAVVICNHQAYSDLYLVQHLAQKAGMLGRCRYFVKKEIVWQVPIFGWAFWAIGMILVSRNWTNDERLIRDAFGRITGNKHDTWTVLYPEGTRKTTKKILESQAFARRAGKPELQHVLWPRTKGFVATIQGLRSSHIQHLYSLTFLYTTPKGQIAPSVGELLSAADLARGGYTFRMHVNRIALGDLPEGEEGLRVWCEEEWGRKDEMLREWVGDKD